MAAAAIVILGRTDLLAGDRPAGLRRQLRQALALMVAARGRPVRREEIADAVWEDADRDPRTLMWGLRRALRDSGSGFDVPPDKSKDGSYRLAATGTVSLPDAVDAFRFLRLTQAAQALRDDGRELAAAEPLAAAAALWAGEPFAGLWAGGQPESCRRLTADLERARGFLVAALAEAALRAGTPYQAARIFLGHPVGDPAGGQAQSRREPGGPPAAPGGDPAWLVRFLAALHDGPGPEEAEQLLAARHAAARNSGNAAGPSGGGVLARADDLLLLAEAGIDVHRPLTVAPPAPVTGSPSALVGRDTELAVFQRLLAAVRDGHPALLAVRGASGLGKTRLAEEFAAAAVSADVPALLLSAGPPGDLRPWQELAGRLWPAACRALEAGRDGSGRSPGLPLSQLTLGQRRALLDFIAPRGAPPEPDQGQQLRFAEIARALSVLARSAAGRRGLVVALDNADRLTARGRELLALLLAGLRDDPVGFVLLGQDDTVPALADPADGAAGDPAGRGWASAVVTVRGDAAVLRLGPLPEPAIAAWLEQVSGHPPAAAEAELIARSTGGEPARIRGWVAAAALENDVAAELTEGRAGPVLPETLPPGTLPPGTVPPGASPAPSPWLAAAAITAADLIVDTALVARMLELPEDAADTEERLARRLGWIDTSAGVRFTRGSQRDGVIARLDTDPALRRSLHRRAFEALSARVRDGGDPDPGLAVRIAGHARGADRDLPAETAARAFLAAARAERASGEAAESWAGTALARAATAGDEVDPATRACLHLALGDALDQRGSVAAADREYQLAYDTAAAAPVERAEALIRLARRWTDPGKIDWYLLHGLQDGIAALEGRTDDTAVALRLQLTGHLARKSTLAVPVLGTDADSIRRAGVALARAALTQVEPLAPAAACEVLNECRWALYDYAPPAETAALSERLERTSLLARSPYFQSEALMTLAIDQLRLGRVTDAQGTLLAHERTMPPSHANQWLQLTMETVLDLWHGRLADAESRMFGRAAPIVARAFAEQERVADTLQQTWQGQVFWLRREQGRPLRESDPEVFRQIEGHAFFPIWRVGLALAAADENDLPVAAAHVRALWEEHRGFASFPPHGWTVPVAALLAETILLLSPAGRAGAGPDPLGGLLPEIAGRLRAILGAHAGEFVLGGWPSVLLGPAARFSGLLALATGRHDEASALFDQVSGLVAGFPVQAARLRVDQAQAQLARARDAGSRAGLADAARALAEASAAASRLGLRGVAGQADELLTRLTGGG